MKKLVLLIICTLSIAGLSISAMAYADTDNSIYNNAIAELSQLGIISGFDDDTFRPQEYVTRAQAAKLFAAATGFSEDEQPFNNYYQNKKNDFQDFTSSHWAFKYACYLMATPYIFDENGSKTPSVRVIDGFEDSTFKPDDYVTAAQFLKMAICSFGNDGYYLEAEKNGGYPNGYIYVSQKYGFLTGVDFSDINNNLTREQAAKILSNTINIPVRVKVTYNDINDNHEMVQNSFAVTYDGKNKHYPLTTFKSMLIADDWHNKINAYIDISPLDDEETEEFFAYGTIDAASDSEITIIPTGIINTDGSQYIAFDKFIVKSDMFEFKADDTYYYFKFQKQGNEWVVVNYAIISR